MPFNSTANGAEDIKDYQGKNLRRKGDTLSQNDTQKLGHKDSRLVNGRSHEDDPCLPA